MNNWKEVREQLDISAEEEIAISTEKDHLRSAEASYHTQDVSASSVADPSSSVNAIEKSSGPFANSSNGSSSIYHYNNTFIGKIKGFPDKFLKPRSSGSHTSFSYISGNRTLSPVGKYIAFQAPVSAEDQK